MFFRRSVLLVVILTLCTVQAMQLAESQVVHYNLQCKSNADCPYNAFCSDDSKFCKCHNGFVHDNATFCLPEATKPGDKCSKAIQCKQQLGDNADCLNGECKCIPGNHFAEGICHKFVKIGEQCTGQSDCFTASGTPVSCNERGVCQCEAGYSTTDNRSDCLLYITLGEKCTIPDECVAEHATCDNNLKICSCYSGHTPSRNKQRCLKYIYKLNAECEEDMQCRTENTVCRHKKCACKSGTKLHGDKCDVVESKDSAGLGVFCDSSANCTTEKSECSQDICACRNGWVAAADNKDCIEVAEEYNAKCKEPAQCTTPFGDNAECKDNHCVCRPGYFFSEKKCLKDKVLGSPCWRSVECHIADDGDCQRMECVTGICVCKQGFKPVEDKDGKRCSGVSPRGAGGVSIAAVLFLLVGRILTA